MEATNPPESIQTHIGELNAGDVGHEEFPEGILHYEGFSDQCWQAHIERFGSEAGRDTVLVVETEMHADWLSRHPGHRIDASGWEGGQEPWDDCVAWAWLVKEEMPCS